MVGFGAGALSLSGGRSSRFALGLARAAGLGTFLALTAALCLGAAEPALAAGVGTGASAGSEGTGDGPEAGPGTLEKKRTFGAPPIARRAGVEVR